MTKEILFWRGSAEVRLTLIRALQGEGYSVIPVASVWEVLEYAAKNYPACIVIDTSGSEQETNKRIKEFSQAEGLSLFPILFVGSGVVEKTKILSKQYKMFQAVNVPFKITDIFTAISNLSTQKTSINKLSPQKEEPVKKIVEADPSQLITTRGGKLMAGGNSLESFDDKVLIPPHPKKEVIEKGLVRITTIDGWLGLHSRRTAYVASAIANSLAFGEKRDENIRTVSLLVNWGLLEDGLMHAKSDPLLYQTSKEFNAIAEGYLRSADFIGKRLEDEVAARTVSVMAKLLSKGRVDEEKNLIRDAYCALLTEFSDRACWSKGYWDSHGAYRMIERIQNNKLFFIDKDIAKAIICVLSEAASSTTNLKNVMISRTIDKVTQLELSTELQKSIKDAEHLFGKTGHAEMELFALAPGMRIVRPIVTMQGRILIQHNTQLDDNMIIRLWQLSTVVPIRTPVLVSRESLHSR
jgi:CheY-like chemotaxis protein